MAAGEQSDQRVLDHALLAEDDPADLVLDLVELGDRGLDRRSDVGILIGDDRHAGPSAERANTP